ncbi:MULTISPECIES: sugar transferase [unclassified Streptomyces]|uniref:sugar transferase n=1 Tax=unclassified Streptomyces TaxID=2593676 RepID=UPI0023664CF5|nr:MULTISPECIES: sugar transferase [unclassified Streptomyces]MDF3140920.1 sugar transferase [Streptomyces sp. T21Q-yed]WDF40535.1 sugar transferase [Streptomyces sp. T12]
MRQFTSAASGQAIPLTPHRSTTPQRPAQGWCVPVAVGADSLGMALPTGVTFAAIGAAHPVHQAVTITFVWVLVGLAARRYASWTWDEGAPVGPVVRDWLVLLGALAVLRTVFGLGEPPAAVLAALCPSLAVTVVCRKAIHRRILAVRRRARGLRRVLVVGEAGAVDAVVGQLAERTDHGYVVVGACVLGEGDVLSGLPVPARLRVGVPTAADEDAVPVAEAAEALGADLVFVTTGRHMCGDRLRRLSWALHDRGRRLMVLPGIVEVARRRVRIASAAGLTLLDVSPPTRRGLPTLLKAATDRAGSLVLLMVLAPLFALLALAVRVSSPGPVIYRQVRVGRDGTPFPMWKFRTMVVDADRIKGDLAAANEHDGHMFKLRRDPRVTSAGRFLRRYSLDELPQLANVLLGHMSLVGPRPPLPEEVARYDQVEMRRLSVKPGLTGLWQVSGRSDLSWHETVSLDLRYVDNWSWTWDMTVMARTVRAVLDGRGAY